METHDEIMLISDRNRINISLTIHQCGVMTSPPGRAWGPQVVDNFILYYVNSGKGIIKINGVEHTVTKGQGFMIPPNVLTSTLADENDPWEYSWVAFSGYLVDNYLYRADLSVEHPVYQDDSEQYLKKQFDEMIEFSKTSYNRYCKMMGALYNVMWRLIDLGQTNRRVGNSTNNVEYYIRRTLEYIDLNYAEKISVDELAKHVGLTRKYFYHIFKTKQGISPQEYLIEFRMEKARALMDDKVLSIADIARSVGYPDQFHFSKTFKNYMGVSPREYCQHSNNSAEDENAYKVHIQNLKFVIEKKNSEIQRLKQLLKVSSMQYKPEDDSK